MDIRIFTLPFDPIAEGFPDEVVADFCRNKKLYDIQYQFFMKDGEAFWTVALKYDTLLKAEKAPRDLDATQQVLFEKLRQWRKERADKEGLPAYLLATNAQLVEMVRRKCTTYDQLKSLKGFGKQKVGKYAQDITNLIKAFYDAPPTP